MKKYDFIVVGAGLFGATFANLARNSGKSVLVVEKRQHVGGNCYTKNINGINVHEYGAHIFHTSSNEVWDFVRKFATFNNFVNSPIARFNDDVYNLPFNMNTFRQLWGVVTPKEAEEIIKQQIAESGILTPRNLEERAISLVGVDVYEKLIKGYTEKQWGCRCSELPASIINRIPVRFMYDNNYFDDKYQGIPIGGYTDMIKRMLSNIEVYFNIDFINDMQTLSDMADKIVYTGPIDEFFGFRYGLLKYRSLRFETKTLNCKNYQGNAVVNYTARGVPFTRVIEHKHFEFGNQETTVVTWEYPEEWSSGKERFYTVNGDENMAMLEKYKVDAAKAKNVIFGGRLAEYKYYDMDDTILSAMRAFDSIK